MHLVRRELKLPGMQIYSASLMDEEAKIITVFEYFILCTLHHQLKFTLLLVIQHYELLSLCYYKPSQGGEKRRMLHLAEPTFHTTEKPLRAKREYAYIMHQD